MNLEYIRINSINDLDPRKISIRELHRRYIDPQGNRFAARFNLISREIEIVRVFSSKDEALKARNEILRRKEEQNLEFTVASSRNQAPEITESKSEYTIPDQYEPLTSDAIQHNTLPPVEEQTDLDPYFDDDLTRPSLSESDEVEILYERRFMEEITEEIQKNRDRMSAIINNIRKSRYFEGKDADLFSELSREVDIQVWQNGENVLNYYKELFSYPRPITYYITRITPDQKERAEKIADDDTRLELIRRWECQRSFQNYFDTLKDVSIHVDSVLSRISDDTLKLLPALQQQLLADSVTGCTVVENEVSRIQKKISIWKRKFP